jgi:signal transduction histidine kinase/CheY-like chemotaxis protein
MPIRALLLFLFIPALLPFILILLKIELKIVLMIAAPLNLVAWVTLAWFQFRFMSFRQSIYSLAKDLRFSTEDLEDFGGISNLVTEVRRRSQLLSSDLLQQSLSSSEQLSESLNRVLQTAFSILDLESAELALRDSQSGLFHSSFSIGNPFKTELVSYDETKVNEEAGIVAEPIIFAGTNLGTLRVAFGTEKQIKQTDLYLLNVLALQSGLAILNTKYTDELLRMKQNSDDSVKAKTGFLANLSHEIRGPLGTILNAAELVVEGLCGPVSEEQRETLKMVQNNGSHLLDLINDVLDYSKIEAGKIVPRPEALNVSEMLADVSAVVRSQAVAKHHKTIVKPTPDAWFLTCDRRHLRQMLINLLSNAIKYTPNGGQIEVWAEQLPSERVRINIKDNGIGMAKEDHYKVFSAFERIENEYTRNQIGTGLGMPLTKRMAEVNGGRLDFDSAEGQGSHFWLVLPSASESDVKSKAKSDLPPQEAVGHGELILLLDSDDEERIMVERYLRHRGFTTVSFASLDHSLRGQSLAPRLALVGNSLLEEGSSSSEKIRLLRDCCAQANFPIVLVSSRAFSFDIEEYLRQGIDYCVSKPIELRKLGIVCRDLLDGRPVSIELNA